MLGLCVVTYGCARLLLNAERPASVKARAIVAGTGIMAILCVLIFFKYGSVQQAILRRQPASASEAAHLIVLIGISYSSFKAMHFIIEAYKRTLKNPTFVAFLNYVLFFPSFISGPINRYNHFYEHSAEARNSTFRSDLAAGFERIVHGLFKKTVLTMVLLPYTLKNMGTPIQEMCPLASRARALRVRPLFLFRLLRLHRLGARQRPHHGIRPAGEFRSSVPEEEHPATLGQLAHLLDQLVDRLHLLALGPETEKWRVLQKTSGPRFQHRHRGHVRRLRHLARRYSSFVLWGLYHGLGIAAVNTYQNWKRKVRHPAARAYFGSAYSRVIGTVMTFNFFAMGLLPFVLDLQQIRMLLGRLV